MINSKSNPLIKRVRKLLNDASYRNEQREFIIEGTKIVLDTLFGNAGRKRSLNAVICSSHYMACDKAEELSKIVSDRKIPLIVVSDPVMTSLSSLQTGQGIIAIAEFIDRPFQEIFHNDPHRGRERHPGTGRSERYPLFVGACGIQDPGNIGALMRTADAGGATAFLTFEDCADIYNPKCVRGSTGSIFTIPIARGLKSTEILPAVKDLGITVLATASDGPAIYTDLDFDHPMLVLFGSEGRGLPESYNPFVDTFVSIPMYGEAESLNVNASAAIIIFERSRKWPAK